MPDINLIRNITSGAIREADKEYRKQPGAMRVGSDDVVLPFTDVFTKAIDNVNTTNAYLSDAENEEIKWSLGLTQNTHDLSIALQKAQIALQYTVAVRDRAIAAYREIMQMQI